MGVNLSIVVSIYNSELTLDRCIRSIIYQEYKDIEILLINDGSCDKSEDICKKWVEKFSSIIFYYKKKNEGVSSARNLGLLKARGNFIQFVDADDSIICSYSSKMIEHAKSVDLVISGYKIMGNGKLLSTITPKKRKYSYIEFLENILTLISPENIFNTPWNKIYRLNLIKDNNIKFREGCSLGQDALFNIDYVSKCQYIQTISDVLYIYEKGILDAATSIPRISWYTANYEIKKNIEFILNEEQLYSKECANYNIYIEQLTSRYFTRLYGFKKQEKISSHIKCIYKLLYEYKKWNIVTKNNQKKTTKYLLFLIENENYLIGTLYVLVVRFLFLIKKGVSNKVKIFLN